eukprot:3653028-Alexandrium_andersonii.AAC.1
MWEPALCIAGERNGGRAPGVTGRADGGAPEEGAGVGGRHKSMAASATSSMGAGTTLASVATPSRGPPTVA